MNDKANIIEEKIINIFAKLNTYLNSASFLNRSREKEKYFIRKRKFPFIIIIAFIMNFRFGSTQAELNYFFKSLNDIELIPDKSSFFKARKKIKAEALLDLVEKASDYFYQTDLPKKWHGFRLISSDGSTFTIPLTGSKEFDRKLIEYFGRAENQYDNLKVIQGHGQILYDCLNKVIITGILTANSANEREILSKQLNRLNSNDLLLLDRGYPAVWLFGLLNTKNIQFVIRIPKKFLTITNDFFESNENDKIVKIKITPEIASENPELNLPLVEIKIRLVKVFLDDGEIEVLATSLIDQKQFKYSIFKELYFKRWGIEIRYNSLKNKLKVEWFSGKTVKVVLQDFYAKLFQENLFTLVSLGTNEELKENTINNKYEYAINENISYSVLKNTWVKLFLYSVKKIKYVLVNLIKNFLKHIEPIRPNRKYERIIKQKSKSTMIAYANRIAI